MLVRYLTHGRVTWARPVTVVEDRDDSNVLFLCADTPTKERVLPDGSPIPRSMPYEERSRLPLKLGDGNWGAHQTLLLTPPGAAHSIWLFWTVDWGFLGWYVNLQEPQRRTPVGFDTVDQVLDLWVEPDLTWRWKDEHELGAAVRLGRFKAEEAAEIRAEGERVIDEFPFPTGWEEWRPDPAWTVPQLPEGWDAV